MFTYCPNNGVFYIDYYEYLVQMKERMNENESDGFSMYPNYDSN